MIELPRAIRDQIARQARQELPNECCGYLGGEQRGEDIVISRRFAMTNVDGSPEHFSFDPREQFAALKEARTENLVLVANYHSHPVTPARMSNEDIRLANDTSIRYLIYSVSDDVLKAFAVDRERAVTEVPIVLRD
jgi:proteasome lid subunit RPN8/RPN11